MCTLPILVAARNEEQSVTKSLFSFSKAAELFLVKNPEMRVQVVVCDNGSGDGTAPGVLESAKKLNQANFEILLINEPRRGKINALRTAVKHIQGPATSALAVIFADADIEWERQTLNELWDCWRDSHGAARLVGAKVVRNKPGCPNVCEILERVPYLGYGEGPHGHGLFCRFACGMTYLADPGILKFFWRMPEDVINEDLMLSYFACHQRIWVCPTAIVRYSVADRWSDFRQMRGRQITGCLQLTEWMAQRLYARIPESRRGVGTYRSCYRKAARNVAKIIETRTLPMAWRLLAYARTFLKSDPERPLCRIKKVAVVVFGMLPVYTFLKLRCRLDLESGALNPGWEPVRRKPPVADASFRRPTK